MTSSNTGNPFFDAWWAGSQQLIDAQTEWFSSLPFSSASADTQAVFDGAQENWEKCEEQFQAWLSAANEWFQFENDEAANDNSERYSESFEALKSMLSPTAFFQSGIAEFDQVFQRLADGPDFADFGVYEKKFLRINQDWQTVQKASADYQAIIARTWAEAFRIFTQDLSQYSGDEVLQPKMLLQQWLETANQVLIEMQRSDTFLKAQSNLVEAHTQMRLQQKEMAESWCEAMVIPTRSEVDDLHQMVYQLRREVRSLKRQLAQQQTTLVEPVVSVELDETAENTSKEAISTEPLTTAKDSTVAIKTAKKPVSKAKKPTSKKATTKVAAKKTAPKKAAVKQTSKPAVKKPASSKQPAKAKKAAKVTQVKNVAKPNAAKSAQKKVAS